MSAQSVHPSSTPRQLLNLAGFFDYPSSSMAEQLQLGLEELEESHIRLFVNSLGGVKAPPYAGCYLSLLDRRQFMIEFSGLCLRHGIVLGPSQPPDHIPAMLEALALLLADDRVSGDQPDPKIADLLDTYYSHWPESFAMAVEEHDETGFYATAAEALRETLAGLRQSAATRMTIN